MPLDLNQFEIPALADRIAQLQPGQSILTNDNLAVRKRHNTPGYDCIVGTSGYGVLRLQNPVEAAEFIMDRSAKREDPKSLGGATRFESHEEAIESVRKGEAKPSGPSPAAKALRRLMTNGGLHSYRMRAQTARDALASGDVNKAVQQIEAIIEHAGGNGRLKDVERAEAVLASIRENHDMGTALPELKKSRVSSRVVDGKWAVYLNGAEVARGLSAGEAEERKRFLTREAARREAVEDIDTEIKELPSALSEEAA